MSGYDRPVPPPTAPAHRGPPCPRCNVPQVVDFQLPRCANAHCGRVRPCQCTARGIAPDPYETVVHTYSYGGPTARPATFCRTCGDEVGK